MAKILNLSKLDTKEVRELVIDGEAHPIAEMTVSNFIETSRVAERIADAPLCVQVEATVDMVVRSVPTVSREALMKQSLSNLNMIAAFVRGDDVGVESEDASQESETPAAEGEAKN